MLTKYSTWCRTQDYDDVLQSHHVTYMAIDAFGKTRVTPIYSVAYCCFITGIFSIVTIVALLALLIASPNLAVISLLQKVTLLLATRYFIILRNIAVF